MEGLVRWRHPERGLLPSDEFIPVAEETGQIVGLGRWVPREACRQARAWHEAHPDASPLGISVNVSGVKLSQPYLVEEVSEFFVAPD